MYVNEDDQTDSIPTNKPNMNLDDLQMEVIQGTIESFYYQTLILNRDNLCVVEPVTFSNA